jgi:peptidyl-prolyl cis-trans isomerase SurA
MKQFGKNLLFGAAMVCGLASFSQTSANDPVLMTIDGKPVTKSEFEAVFFKNNPNRVISDPKAVEEYVDLFINFKLKVKEAEEMGLDTMKSFIGELNGYRKQLAGPYLTDKSVNEQLVTEAYDRLKMEVHASHILVKIAEDALPKDTLEAWNKILSFRNRAIKGEDFGKLARESAEKGDPSAKENAGDLGFFTAFQMVYPFENAAYKTKPGEVSMPVRTRFGYHIIKVWETRPSRGEILVKHIMIRIKKNATADDSLNAKKKVQELYDKIKGGASFEEMAQQFSDDKNSATKGGLIDWFGTNKLPKEFEDAAFSLAKNGDISKPFTTSYGWHIVKRDSVKGLLPFESMKAELKQKVAKDPRSQAGRGSLINKIKADNKFTEMTVTKGKGKTAKTSFPALDELVTKVDSTYWDGKWSADKAKGLAKPLFTLGGKTYTQADFAKYLETRQTRRAKNDFKSIITSQYNTWVNEQAIALEESMLDKKYPEFKALMQEYRDGILLFDLTDKKVWTKAMKDTTGLKNFYEANKNNYLWEERADVTFYKCNDEKTCNTVLGMLKKKKADKDITDAVNKSSQLNLNIESITYLKGERKLVDNNWKEGLSGVVKDEDGKFYVLKVNKLMPKSPKALNEAKGIITADYQNYLEKQWLASLREKHKVEVNRDVLKMIK